MNEPCSTMAKTANWKLLFFPFLIQWTHLVAADNSSVIYSPTIEGQQVLWDAGGQATYNDYLKLTLKHELPKRLSGKAGLFLKGEDNFGALDARYTDYKRPQYIAAVQVAEEQDVVETVRLNITLCLQTVAHWFTGEIRTRERNPVRSTSGGSQSYQLSPSH